MKTIRLAIFLGLSYAGLANAQDYQKIHKDMIVVDGHNDVIYSSVLKGKDIGKKMSSGHTDIPRLQKGGVDVQVFAVFSNDERWRTGAFKHANDQIDSLESVVRRNSSKIEIAKSTRDIERIVNEGKIVALIGVESGNMIEESIENLEALYQRGTRYLTLTWNYNLPWATAAAVENKKQASLQKGLSEHGKKIIKKMNELGMMVDLSHASKKTFYDVMAISTKPVLASHSNAAALTPHFRNLDDDQLAALKKNGGVVGVNFYSPFLDTAYDSRVKDLYRKQFGQEPEKNKSISFLYRKLNTENQHLANTPFERVLEHIDYLVQKAGIDHVAIGSDFDGIESPPQQLEDVSKFPVLTQALLQRGYTAEDVSKIMGLNFLRVLKANEN